jgi:hypothetical protein
VSHGCGWRGAVAFQSSIGELVNVSAVKNSFVNSAFRNETFRSTEFLIV